MEQVQHKYQSNAPEASSMTTAIPAAVWICPEEWMAVKGLSLLSLHVFTGAVEQLPSCSTWNGHQLVTHWLLVRSSLRIQALGFAASLASTPSLCDEGSKYEQYDFLLMSGLVGAKCPINYLTCYFHPYPFPFTQIIPVQSSTTTICLNIYLKSCSKNSESETGCPELALPAPAATEKISCFHHFTMKKLRWEIIRPNKCWRAMQILDFHMTSVWNWCWSLGGNIYIRQECRGMSKKLLKMFEGW